LITNGSDSDVGDSRSTSPGVVAGLIATLAVGESGIIRREARGYCNQYERDAGSQTGGDAKRGGLGDSFSVPFPSYAFAAGLPILIAPGSDAYA